MKNPEIVQKFINWAEEKKAENIETIDVSEKVYYTDTMIVCSATGSLHLKAIAEHIEDMARAEKIYPISKEGYDALEWVLLDFSDIIIHIFLPQVRENYKLEDLWTQAAEIREN